MEQVEPAVIDAQNTEISQLVDKQTKDITIKKAEVIKDQE